MNAERLDPQRAVRLLRAKASELEAFVKGPVPEEHQDVVYLAADIALIASILADFMETLHPVIGENRWTGPERLRKKT